MATRREKRCGIFVIDATESSAAASATTHGTIDNALFATAIDAAGRPLWAEGGPSGTGLVPFHLQRKSKEITDLAEQREKFLHSLEDILDERCVDWDGTGAPNTVPICGDPSELPIGAVPVNIRDRVEVVARARSESEDRVAVSSVKDEGILPPFIKRHSNDIEPDADIDALRLSLFNHVDADVLAATEITNGDHGNAPGSAMDPALGATPELLCATCMHTKERCTQHTGVIKLQCPVPNPLLLTTIRRLLGTSCRKCGVFLLGLGKPDEVRRLLQLPQRIARGVVRAEDMRDLSLLKSLADRMKRLRRILKIPASSFEKRLDEASTQRVAETLFCFQCGEIQPKAYKCLDLNFFMEFNEKKYASWYLAKHGTEEPRSAKEERMQPMDPFVVLKQLQRIRPSTMRIVGLKVQDVTGLMMTTLPIMSLRTRFQIQIRGRVLDRGINPPIQRLATSNSNLRLLRGIVQRMCDPASPPEVVEQCQRDIAALDLKKESIAFLRNEVTARVFTLFGQKVPEQHDFHRMANDSGNAHSSIPDMINGKNGILRKFVSGATLNNTGRAVLSLNSSAMMGAALRLPYVFARRMGREVAVTESNIEQVRAYVRQGAYVVSFKRKMNRGVCQVTCQDDCSVLVMWRSDETADAPDNGDAGGKCPHCDRVLCGVHLRAHTEVGLCPRDAEAVAKSELWNKTWQLCSFGRCVRALLRNDSCPRHGRHYCKHCDMEFCPAHAHRDKHTCITQTGALAVKTTEGQEFMLSTMKYPRRLQLARRLAVGDVVQRSLQNGDMFIGNRNPTLWMHGVFAGRIVLTHDAVFGIPWQLCPGTNADFDGDEGNISVPLGLEPYAELNTLMAIEKNMRSPSGHSLSMHPSLSTFTGMFYLTQVDAANKSPLRFFNGAQVQQFITDLAFLASDDAIERCVGDDDGSGTRRLCERLPPPDIHVEEFGGDLWSGHSVFSMLLPSTTHYGPVDMGIPGPCTVTIRDGVLTQDSVLSKKALAGGAGSLSLHIHSRYGYRESMRFNACVIRLGEHILKMCGLTVSFVDVMGTSQMTQSMGKVVAEIKRRIPQLEKIGAQTGMSAPEIEEGVEKVCMKALPAATSIVKRLTSATSHGRITTELARAKGSPANLATAMVAACQQMAFQERRGVVMTRDSVHYGNTLPCYKEDSRDPEARGFVVGGLGSAKGPFVGLEACEYFYVMESGLAGLITSTVDGVKNTGTLQRVVARTLEMFTSKQGVSGSHLITNKGTRNERIASFSIGECGLDVRATTLESIEPLTQSDSAFEESLRAERAVCPEIADLIEWLVQACKQCGSKRFPVAFDVQTIAADVWQNAKEAHAARADDGGKEEDVNAWSREMLQAFDGVFWPFASALSETVYAEKRWPTREEIANEGMFCAAPSLLNALWHLRTSGPIYRSIHGHVGYLRRICEAICKRHEQAKVEPGTPQGLITAYAMVHMLTQVELNTFHRAGMEKGNNVLTDMKQLFGMSPTRQCYVCVDVPKDETVRVFRAFNTVGWSDIIQETGGGRPSEIGLSDSEMREWTITARMYSMQVSETMAIIRFNKRACLREAVSMGEIFSHVVQTVHRMVKKSKTKCEDPVLLPFFICGTLPEDDEWSVMISATERAGGWTTLAPCFGVTYETIRTWKADTVQTEFLLASKCAKVVGAKLRIRGNDVTGHAAARNGKVFVKDENLQRSKTILCAINNGVEHARDDCPSAMRTVINRVEMDFSESVSWKTSYSSNVMDVARTLGIEAARTVLIREFHASLGDGVSRTHMINIADCMTINGTPEGITQAKVDQNSENAPFAAAMVKKAIKRLTRSALRQEVDNLSQPSSRTVVGSEPPLGTRHPDMSVRPDPAYIEAWRQKVEGGSNGVEKTTSISSAIVAEEAKVAKVAEEEGEFVAALDFGALDEATKEVPAEVPAVQQQDGAEEEPEIVSCIASFLTERDPDDSSAAQPSEPTPTGCAFVGQEDFQQGPLPDVGIRAVHYYRSKEKPAFVKGRSLRLPFVGEKENVIEIAPRALSQAQHSKWDGRQEGMDGALELVTEYIREFDEEKQRRNGDQSRISGHVTEAMKAIIGNFANNLYNFGSEFLPSGKRMDGLVKNVVSLVAATRPTLSVPSTAGVGGGAGAVSLGSDSVADHHVQFIIGFMEILRERRVADGSAISEEQFSAMERVLMAKFKQEEARVQVRTEADLTICSDPLEAKHVADAPDVLIPEDLQAKINTRLQQVFSQSTKGARMVNDVELHQTKQSQTVRRRTPKFSDSVSTKVARVGQDGALAVELERDPHDSSLYKLPLVNGTRPRAGRPSAGYQAALKAAQLSFNRKYSAEKKARNVELGAELPFIAASIAAVEYETIVKPAIQTPHKEARRPKQSRSKSQRQAQSKRPLPKSPRVVFTPSTALSNPPTPPIPPIPSLPVPLNPPAKHQSSQAKQTTLHHFFRRK